MFETTSAYSICIVRKTDYGVLLLAAVAVVGAYSLLRHCNGVRNTYTYSVRSTYDSQKNTAAPYSVLPLRPLPLLLLPSRIVISLFCSRELFYLPSCIRLLPPTRTRTDLISQFNTPPTHPARLDKRATDTFYRVLLLHATTLTRRWSLLLPCRFSLSTPPLLCLHPQFLGRSTPFPLPPHLQSSSIFLFPLYSVPRTSPESHVHAPYCTLAV